MLVKKIGLGVVVGALLASTVSAANPYGAPDVSVIGNIVGVIDNDSDNKSGDQKDPKFNVAEFELGIGAQIDDNIRGDAYITLEKQASGDHEVDLDEAYLTLTNVPSMLLGGRNNIGDNLEIAVGKKLVNITRSNVQHREDWNFSSRSYAGINILGTEGLQTEGVEVSWELPVDWFAGWTVSVGKENDSETDYRRSSIGYDSTIIALSTGQNFKVSDKSSVDLGLGYILDEDQKLLGVDLVYNCNSTGSHAGIEYLSADNDGETYSAWTAEVVYDWGNGWDTGLRYGITDEFIGQTDDTTELAIAATRQVSETAKIRFEYSTISTEAGNNDSDTNELRIQLLFGMGKGASNI